MLRFLTCVQAKPSIMKRALFQITWLQPYRAKKTPWLAGLLLFLLPVVLTLPDLGAGEAVRDRYVEARLVSSVESARPGEDFWIALRLDHDAGWHTYWQYSTTGYAPSVDWDLPEGWEASSIAWPTPRVYMTAHIVDYIFENVAYLPVRITPPDSWDEAEVTLRGKVDWLMCEEVCIPGSASLSLTIPVREQSPEPDPRWGEAVLDTVTHLPEPLESWSSRAYVVEDRVWLLLQPDADAVAVSELYFFTDNGYVELEERQQVEQREDGSWLFHLERSPYASEADEYLTGVVRAESGWQGNPSRLGMEVRAPIHRESPPGEFAATTADEPELTSLFTGGTLGLVRNLALAFLGGLILNLMPCVFPVIGIKVMGFVQQAGEKRSRVVLHGLLFTLGVLVSFWILAAVIAILRAGGESLGWGFQLQSAPFVFVITILLFVFALNLSGLFEFGQSAIGAGGRLLHRSGFSGSFFSGVLATVVATPCAAPFLAPALGVAFAIPAAESFLIFSVIAIGLATPYLLLSAFPWMIKMLPKPGAWMETFRQAMAFPLYATVGYLVWTLAGQLTEARYGGFAFLALLLGLVVIAMATWIYGRYSGFDRTAKVRTAGRVAALLLLLGGLHLAYPQEKDPDDPLTINWIPWSPQLQEELRDEGKTVFVDFTARWCATCQTNKLSVFSSRRVLQRFADDEIVALQADWTNHDARITEELSRFGRSAIPFNVIYAPGRDDPHILPELLTPGIVLDALDSL